MWAAIKQFFTDNQASIIISAIIGALFFILGPLGLWFSGKKVKREKINKARSEFLDLLESMLVNKENITIPKLITFFHAIERQNGINLGLDSDITNLLEDLSLRFARSKHLSSEQKNSYSNDIENLILELNKTEKEESTLPTKELPKSLKSMFNDLRKEIETKDSDKINDKIDQLEKYFSKPSDPIIRMILTLMKEKPRLIYWIFLIYILIALIVFMIQSFIDK